MQEDVIFDSIIFNLVNIYSDLTDRFEIQLNEVNYLAMQLIESIGDFGLCHVILPLAEALLNSDLEYNIVFLALSKPYELICWVLQVNDDCNRQ